MPAISVKNKYWGTIIWCFCLPLFHLNGQSSLFSILPEDSIIQVQIKTDLKTIIKNKTKPIYQPAMVTFGNGPLSNKTYEAKVKARGNIRRKICYYPPIHIKFQKSTFEFSKLKWVNVCKSGRTMQENLLEEYLIYKLYALLTDHSFGVRLFEAQFVHPESDEESLKAYGFLIEPVKALAKRTDTKEYEPSIIRPRILDRYFYPLLSVFEYLVGNSDWHVDNLHNLKFLRSGERNSVIPVPYDFDYSGFVNASYAIPHESLPIKEVTERHNKAHCMTPEELEEVLKLVLSKKAELLNEVATFELLPEKSRAALVRYLEAGFEVLAGKKLPKRIFVDNCKEYKK